MRKLGRPASWAPLPLMMAAGVLAAAVAACGRSDGLKLPGVGDGSGQPRDARPVNEAASEAPDLDPDGDETEREPPPERQPEPGREPAAERPLDVIDREPPPAPERPRDAGRDGPIDQASPEPPAATCFPSGATIPGRVSYGWTRSVTGILGFRGGTPGPMAAGPDGSIVYGGWLVGAADFDPTPAEDIRSNSEGTCFVSKLGADGSYQWTRNFGSAGGLGCELLTVAVGLDGAILLVGNFRGGADLDPGPGYDLHGAMGLYNDAFVSKLDASGRYLWGRTWGGDPVDEAVSVAAGPRGEVLVAGSFGGLVDFNRGHNPPAIRGGGDRELFVVKFNSGGDLAWVRAAGGQGPDVAWNLAVTRDGSVLVTGQFMNTIDFSGSGGALHTAVGDSFSDAFVWKLGVDGAFGWARSFGGSAADIAYGVAEAPGGAVLVTGTFMETVDFNRGGSTAEIKRSAGQTDAYLLKVGPDGTFCWNLTWGGPPHDIAYAVATSSRDGSIRVAGSFGGSSDFDPSIDYMDRKMAWGRYTGFISTFAADATYANVYVFPSAGIESANAISMLPDGSFASWGVFENTYGSPDFDPGPDEDRHMADKADFFLTRLFPP